jgi:arginine deiminase
LNFFSLFKRNFLYKFKKKINIDLQENINILSLDKLFTLYNTDKANLVDSGTKQGHGFAKFYEKNLNHFKNKEKINILELGSFAGASAAAFSKYFPNSLIY